MKKVTRLKLFNPVKTGLLTAALMLYAFAGFAYTVTINLTDHAGGSTIDGTAAWYNGSGSWHPLSSTVGGVVTVDLPAGSYQFSMNYHGLTQTTTWTPVTSGGVNIVSFQTQLVTMNLYNHNGVNGANMLAGGTPGYYTGTGSWNTLSNTVSTGANPQVELLPGSYEFNMKYNSLTQTTAWTVVGAAGVGGGLQDVNFVTELVTMDLYNHNGAGASNMLAGGTPGYYTGTGSWNTLSNTVSSGTNPQVELLPGSYEFNMKYNSLTQTTAWTVVGAAGAGGGLQDVNFVTELVTMDLYNHNGAGASNMLAGGTPGYYTGTGSWNTLSNTVSTGANPQVELLPGSYEFNMKYNSLTQTTAWTAVGVAGVGGGLQNVDFVTELVTMDLYNHNGAGASNMLAGGTPGYYTGTGSWNTLSNTVSSGTNPQVELLPGSYEFNMKYNSLTQTTAWTVVGTGGVGGGLQDVNYQTTLVSANLRNCAGTLINTTSATAQFYTGTGSWQNFSSISGGTTSAELLPGSYEFNMNYNHFTQTKTWSTIGTGPTQPVDFNTTKVTFSNPNSSAVSYYTGTGSWNTFDQPSMEMLPGSYQFITTSGGPSTPWTAISGCGQTYYIQPAGPLSITSDAISGCGGTVTLVAPAGGKSYLWSPNGETTQSVVANANGDYSVAVAYDFTSAGAASVGTTTYSTTISGVVPNTVVVKLQDSHGNGLPNGTVSYYHSGWFVAGTTNSDGVVCAVVPSGTSSMKLEYLGGSKQWDGVVPSGNPVYIATTAPVTINLKDHNGDLYTSESGTPSLYEGTSLAWVNLTTTGTLGYTNAPELLPGSYSFGMNFHTHTYRPVANFTIVAGPNNVDFQTTLVSINLKNCAGALLGSSAIAAYYGGSWSSNITFTGSTQVELLQGSYSVAMYCNNTHTQTDGNMVGAGPTQDISFHTTSVSVNNPNGSAVSYYGYSGWLPFTSPTELLPVPVIFHSNSSAPNVTETITGCAQTLYITPCTLPGVTAAGNGGCGASSTLTAPAGSSYSWSPSDGLSSSTTQSVVASPSVTTTYSVTVGYDFTCAGTIGVPVTYTVTVGAATANVYTVRLIDSKGNGIAGGQVQYYNGTWNNFTSASGGLTNSDGFACTTLSPGSHTFHVIYAYGTQQWTATVAAYNAIYPVQTTNVAVRLLNSSGNLITSADAGTTVQYYIGGWRNINGNTTGTTGTDSIELLPGSYIFHLTYAHATQQLASRLIGAGPVQTVDFTTTAVTATLTSNSGAGTGLSGGVAQYYNGGWYDMGTTDATGTTPGIELLPLSYQFHMTYAHATYQMPGSTNVSTTPTIAFTTISTNASLKANGGAGSALSGGVAQYYSGGWYDMGTTDATGNTPAIELLPVSYPFHMTYNFATYQWPVSINVSTTPTIAFTTTTVKASLKANGGAGGGLSSAIAQYYSGGWHYMGTTDGTGLTPSVELLPVSYPFHITYAHATFQTTANVAVAGSAQTVPFTTTTVTASLISNGGAGSPLSGGVAQYYSGGWYDMGTTDGTGVTSSIELLPVSYPFHITYAHATYQLPGSTAVCGATKNVPFTTTTVTASLADHTGSGPLNGGCAQYYSGGWWPVGTTVDGTTPSVELLPMSYPFHMTYAHATYQLPTSVNVATTPNAAFQTALVTIQFKGHSGTPIDDATIGYYAGGWWNFANPTQYDAVNLIDGVSSMELLPVSYTFNATKTGLGTTQSIAFPAETAGSASQPTHIITNASLGRQAAPGAGTVTNTSFTLFPNPATDKITIQYSSVNNAQATVQVTDIAGKVIMDQAFESVSGANTHDLDMSSLPSGMYMIMFSNEGNNEVRKINVMH